MTESLDVIADLLKYHHHSNQGSDLDSHSNDPADLVFQRQCVIALHVLLARIVQTLVPVDKVRVIVHFLFMFTS